MYKEPRPRGPGFDLPLGVFHLCMSQLEQWSPAILDFRFQILDLTAQRFTVGLIIQPQSAICNLKSSITLTPTPLNMFTGKAFEPCRGPEDQVFDVK